MMKSRPLIALADVEEVDGPLDNPNSQLREVWLRGPEGYMVVVSGPKG